MTESAEGAGDITREASAIVHAVEPPSALVVGGILGGCAFLLCALLFGARVAICIAALGTLAALWRRVPGAAVGFSLATLVVIAAAASTTALLAASALFGVALALFARVRMRTRVAAAIDGRVHRGPVGAG